MVAAYERWLVANAKDAILSKPVSGHLPGGYIYYYLIF
jgi:hypothetical protein